MDKFKEIAIINEQITGLEYRWEVRELSEDNVELLNSVYKEVCENLGLDAAMEIYRLFKGQQISFPLHFFNPTKIHKQIVQEYDGTNTRKLAVKYGYSEKSIRRIIKTAADKY